MRLKDPEQALGFEGFKRGGDQCTNFGRVMRVVGDHRIIALKNHLEAPLDRLQFFQCLEDFRLIFPMLGNFDCGGGIQPIVRTGKCNLEL